MKNGDDFTDGSRVKSKATAFVTQDESQVYLERKYYYKIIIYYSKARFDSDADTLIYFFYF